MAGKAEISQIYDAETVIWRVGPVILVAVKRYEGERSVSRDRNLMRFRYILRADRNGRNDFAADRIENVQAHVFLHGVNYQVTVRCHRSLPIYAG
jgi:hypothetical protein